MLLRTRNFIVLGGFNPPNINWKKRNCIEGNSENEGPTTTAFTWSDLCSSCCISSPRHCKCSWFFPPFSVPFLVLASVLWTCGTVYGQLWFQEIGVILWLIQVHFDIWQSDPLFGSSLLLVLLFTACLVSRTKSFGYQFFQSFWRDDSSVAFLVLLCHSGF